MPRKIKTKEPDVDTLVRFRRACRDLQRISRRGFEIYVSGSGNVHLMRGPSHDEHGNPLRENVVETFSVPRMSGGDW